MSIPKKSENGRNLPPDARQLACQVLESWFKRPERTTQVLHLAERAAADAGLDRRDRALACELVLGVVRHRLTLTRILGTLTRHGWPKVRRDLQPVLLIGAYQILWLESVPDFAAVDVAVTHARQRAGQGAARFVNAVLRSLIRSIETYRAPLAEADPRRTFPIRGGQGCVLEREVFADPDRDLPTWLVETTSHPRPLVARWIHTYGHEQTRQICMAGLTRPPLVLRPNTLKTTPTELRTRLESEGVEAALTEDGMIVVEHPIHLLDLPSFQQGFYQPQDPTAARVVRAMNLKPGNVVLDLCAGIGTKSTQIAEAIRDEGTVLACDRDQGKLQDLQANARRLGLTRIRGCSMEGIEEELSSVGRLDWILLDVPCSNTGVLGRRPEARYRFNEKSLASLTAVQRELCERALFHSGPSTRIAYSTCSIEPEENAALMQQFGQSHPDWRLESSEQVLPQATDDPRDAHDGGYWAVWRRS